MKTRLAIKILTMKSTLWKKEHKLRKAKQKMKNKRDWIILN